MRKVRMVRSLADRTFQLRLGLAGSASGVFSVHLRVWETSRLIFSTCFRIRIESRGSREIAIFDRPSTFDRSRRKFTATRTTREATRNTPRSNWVYAYVLGTVPSRLHRGRFFTSCDLEDLGTSEPLQSQNFQLELQLKL